MIMTHYMELLAANQPWNLIMYMAIPVILAEALTATEFVIVFFRGSNAGGWKIWNRWIGIVLGFYFLGVFFYLITSVVPNIQWRGLADIIAVGAYLLCVIPLFAITLLELGVIGKNKSEDAKMKLHFFILIGFLVVTHIAMIFGMLDPTVMGWNPNADVGNMQHMQHMQPMGHQ